MGLTVGLAVFILAALTLVLAGPSIATWLDERLGMGSALKWTWLILQWPLAIALVATALGLLFYFGPDADQDWVWISPGAVFGSVLWLLVSLATKVYVANFSDYNAAYGSVGAVMVVLLWLYVSSIAILVGAELNAEIEHASPHGKAGQKTPTGAACSGQAPTGEERRRRTRRRARAVAAAPPQSQPTVPHRRGRRGRHPRRSRLERRAAEGRRDARRAAQWLRFRTRPASGQRANESGVRARVARSAATR